jgi:hypothetical protein
VPELLLFVPAENHTGTCVATDTTLPVITPFVSIPNETLLLLEKVIVPEDLVFVPAENVNGRAVIAVLNVILPLVSIPADIPFAVELKTIVPVDLELVPAETHNGTCDATDTTLKVTNPFVSIPTETF